MTLDRRTTLKAMVASGVAVGAQPVAAAAKAGRPLSVLIFDGRFDACRAFAESESSAHVLKIDSRESDLGIAWREQIRRHLGRNPGRVEGLSLYADHFISVGMARDLGLRLIADERVTSARDNRVELFKWTIA